MREAYLLFWSCFHLAVVFSFFASSYCLDLAIFWFNYLWSTKGVIPFSFFLSARCFWKAGLRHSIALYHHALRAGQEENRYG